MSKPLELTVYPKRGEGYYAKPWVVLSAASVDRRVQAKRLTDAELAAEVFSAIFHEAECEVRGRRIERGYPPRPGHPAVQHYVKQNREFGRQAGILERFATLPHYDEDQL